LVTEFYAMALASPHDAIQDLLLSALRTVLPFDSAVWATGDHQLDRIHSVRLIDQEPAMLLAYQAHYSGADRVRACAIGSPGRAFHVEDAMGRAEYRSQPVYTEFGFHYGIEDSLGIAQVDSASGLAELIALFRADRAKPFRKGECEQLERLAPHLFAAWRHCQMVALLKNTGPEWSLSRYHPVRAICDNYGVLTIADPDFGPMMQRAFPDFAGSILPPSLATGLANGGKSIGAEGIDAEIRRGDGSHIVSLFARRAIDRLSGAERDVAIRYAGGQGHRKIAAERETSPSTVRNQLAAIYRKLEVSGKAQLAARLAREG
jgi:DNA-binding CsgD family transcriptional regulator